MAVSHCGVLRSAITLSTFTDPPNVWVPPLNRKSLCEAAPPPPRAKQSVLDADGRSRRGAATARGGSVLAGPASSPSSSMVMTS